MTNLLDIIRLLEYAFIQRALIAGSFVGIACAALGMFLVLRKMSLIGDGLSHVSFGAIALGLFFGIYPLSVAIPAVIISSLLILKIVEKTRVYGDTAIGIVSAVGIAGGVILASVSGGFNANILSYLFGSILTISTDEVIVSIGLSFVVLLGVYGFYWELFSTTFDEEYARTTGIRTEFVQSVLVILTAITVVLSVKVVGIMLVSALLIFPAVTSLMLSRRFGAALVLACMVSVLSVVGGIGVSLAWNIPAGAAIIVVNTAMLVLSVVLKSATKKIS